MSSAVVKISEFNASNLSVGQLKTMESGGKMASLGYAGGKLTTQIGPLTLPYGMNVFDKAGPVKYSMDLSLRGYDENPKIRQVFINFYRKNIEKIEISDKNDRKPLQALENPVIFDDKCVLRHQSTLVSLLLKIYDSKEGCDVTLLTNDYTYNV